MRDLDLGGRVPQDVKSVSLTVWYQVLCWPLDEMKYEWTNLRYFSQIIIIKKIHESKNPWMI